MTKEQLDFAMNSIIVLCETEGEVQQFFKDMKEMGGKWINGEEISYNEKLLASTKKVYVILRVRKSYLVSFVSHQIYCYTCYGEIKYRRFKRADPLYNYKEIL